MYRHRQRGVTLLEFIVIAALMAILVTATMRTLGNARFLRGAARDRGEMLTLAQSELDRLRHESAEAFVEGTTSYTNTTLGCKDDVTVTLTKRSDGNWLADVLIKRKGPEGLPDVKLSTICPGGEQ